MVHHCSLFMLFYQTQIQSFVYRHRRRNHGSLSGFSAASPWLQGPKNYGTRSGSLTAQSIDIGKGEHMGCVNKKVKEWIYRVK